MSRIAKAFQNGKVFIGFLTGGDPSMAKTKEFVQAMIKGGAGIIEIGIPFSDPIAEGPEIQGANIRALRGGGTLDMCFTLVEDLRKETDVPLVFLTYFNPVFNYGCEAFFQRAARAGLDGIIIPDLPFEEQAPVREAAGIYGIDIISLIAPTSDTRIKEIAAAASGFIYVVSSMGVTGTRADITTDLDSIVKSIRQVTAIPFAIGFGIHTPAQAAQMARIADGVIVGSAIVKIIAEHGESAGPYVYEYVKRMNEAITLSLHTG
ncbi:MAG: tryptophan synthase subunit alpha [Treponema sp.]|nr:tryptophan synthase subunit alpha [Treponema sp.]